MTLEGWAIVGSILGGFILHLFYFGRGMGRMESDIKHLANSFDDFKAQHFIPRDEYEARHQDLMNVVANLTKGK